MTQEVGRHSVHSKIVSEQDCKMWLSVLCIEDAHLTCSPGAGHYVRTDKVTGKGVKRSMSARHKEGIHAGYPNPLVQPVDTHGRWDILLEFFMCTVTISERCVPVQGLLHQILTIGLLQCVDQNTAVGEPS